MDPEEEYPSDSDASDEDFRPDKDEGSGSELESDDNVEDEDHENGDDESGTKPKAGAGKKRKRAGKKVSKKKAKIVTEEVPDKKETEKKGEELDEEDEERLTDALWADFLAGSNSNSTSSSSKEPAKKEPVKAVAPAVVKTPKPVQTTTIATKPETVTKIFEFAGETVEVTEPAPATEATASKAALKPAALTSNGGGAKPPLGGRPSGGGLGAVLGQLGKKNKLSVLEKTQLDWKSFKRNEGIEEELQTHNRGRDGYLERQDFLQRADLRQFEIEKNFRQSKSKR